MDNKTLSLKCERSFLMPIMFKAELWYKFTNTLSKVKQHTGLKSHRYKSHRHGLLCWFRDLI